MRRSVVSCIGALLPILCLHAVSGMIFQKPTRLSKQKPPGNIKILILPGFANDSADYTSPSERCLVASLQERGWDKSQIAVLPVQRSDWIQVFTKGLFDWKFWLSDAPPTRAAFRWYLERVQQEVADLGENEKLIILGHSAGGWLARAALGFGNCMEIGSESLDLDKVLGLVTLGTPHSPPPPGTMDMTRGALRLTNERFPGAFHDSLFYITVAGLAINGEKQERKSPFEPTTVPGFAFNSYEAVCGDGTVIGDGVVPVVASHLDDALQLNLDGVFHSINSPENWYGSTEKIDLWHQYLLEQVKGESKRANGKKTFASFFGDLVGQETSH